MIDNDTIIVIGSGPAGAMAAHELIRQGSHVTMLESGSELPDGALVRVMGRNMFRRWPGKSPINANAPAADPNLQPHSANASLADGEPQPQWWYNLSLGGLSNQWTGAVPRFAEEDFREGERLHPRYRWPISYADLVPYYEQVERLMRITSDPQNVPNLPAGVPAYPRQLSDDWQRIAHKATHRGQGMTVLPLADGPSCMIAGRSTAFNSYTNIVANLLRSPKFQLLAGAHALQIEYSGESRRVEAVVYHDRATNSQKRIRAAAVMVACGALNSTKLLFDSACAEFPEGLGNTEGLLGSFLHDHPRDWWTFTVDRALSRPSPPVYLTRLPYEASSPLLATSWTLGLLPSKQEKLLSLTPLKGNTFAAQVFGTMVPTQRNFVCPDPLHKDEFGRPRLNLCISYDCESIDMMTAARGQLLSLLEDAGYHAQLAEVPTTLVPGSSVHYGGTIRMHALREHGMLDAYNRVHDIANLLVVDASCFTTGAEKNPTLTVMAIAARAANRLVQDLSRGGAGAN